MHTTFAIPRPNENPFSVHCINKNHTVDYLNGYFFFFFFPHPKIIPNINTLHSPFHSQQQGHLPSAAAFLHVESVSQNLQNVCNKKIKKSHWRRFGDGGGGGGGGGGRGTFK